MVLVQIFTGAGMTKSQVPDPCRPMTTDLFWTRSNAELLVSLETSEAGLTSSEADSRLQSYGPNVAVESARGHLIARLGRRFAEPFVAILLIATVLSGAAGDWASFFIIAVVVVLSLSVSRCSRVTASLPGAIR